MVLQRLLARGGDADVLGGDTDVLGGDTDVLGGMLTCSVPLPCGSRGRGGDPEGLLIQRAIIAARIVLTICI